MPDQRFFETSAPISVTDAIAIGGGALARGDAAAALTHVSSLASADNDSAIVYCEKPAVANALAGKAFGLCFAVEDATSLAGGAVAVTPTPKLAFALVSARLHRSLATTARAENPPGADKSAFIDATATIGENVSIGPNVTIGPGVAIGAGSKIGAGVSITHALIGENVLILPGARIGQSGFGFVAGPDGLVKVPQLGRVVISDGVEIGANSTIDRGALEDTVIGERTKIDNLVQIGHNVRIGRNCIIAAQSGISGSCVIGDGVMMGGQVGLADHLTIGDGAMIAAGAGLMRDVPPGEKWGGRPGRLAKDWLRETAALAKMAKKRND